MTDPRLRLSLLAFAESLGPLPRVAPSHHAAFDLAMLAPDAPSRYPVAPVALAAGMRRSDEKRFIASTVTYEFGAAPREGGA